MLDKAKDYINAGVTRVWVVDPEVMSITVFSPDGSSQLYIDNTTIVDTLFPGLELTPQLVFEEAELLQHRYNSVLSSRSKRDSAMLSLA